MATLVKTLTKGKRKLGWIIASATHGNILVVRRAPRGFAVKTKQKDYLSINKSAEDGEAGWALDQELITAIQRNNVQKVAVHVPRPGVLFITDAKNYFTPGVVYSYQKNKAGDRVKCVGLEHFESRPCRARV